MSLVYKDDVVQKYLKDILIPTLGYRNTYVTFGQMYNQIENNQNAIEEKNVPEKTKIYIHDNITTDNISITVPKTAYKSTDAFYEPIRINIEFGNTSTNELYSLDVIIPTEAYSNSSNIPYIAVCNKEAHNYLKNVKIQTLFNAIKDPDTVYQISFNKLLSNTDIFTRAIVTVYSEHRDVVKTSEWIGFNSSTPGVGIINETVSDLGSVPYFNELTDQEKIVRSNTMRWIEGITHEAMEYVRQAQKADALTLYLETEDTGTSTEATIILTSADEVQRNASIISNIFGDDWSNITFKFISGITDIDNAFANLTFKKAPKAIEGEDVITARGLFQGSMLETIVDQSTLLAKLPLLEDFSMGFKDCASFTDDIEETLLINNNNLRHVQRMLENTSITNTFNIWEMSHTYVPEGKTDSVTVYMDGRYCFKDVTTLPTALYDSIPAYWKEDTSVISYLNKAHFVQFRTAILRDNDNDLGPYTLEFPTETNLDNLLYGTDIKISPTMIVAPNATTAVRMMGECYSLLELKSTLLEQVPNLQDLTEGFINAAQLIEVPENLLATNQSINNYTRTFSGLSNVTGQTPKIEDKFLWELAGEPGFPTTIDGTECFMNSSFDNIEDVPTEWGGV